MSRVVLYSIVSDTQVIEKWICSTRAQLKNFVEKIIKRLSETKSKTIRTLQIQGLWIYYFHQQTFLFVLAAQGPERSVRMQNYLRVMTELFYENYDEKRFATIVDRIMNQINKIQGGQTSSQENEGLISGSSLKHDKQKFIRILAQKQYSSKRAYLITVFLFICILALGIYYLLRKTKDQS